MKRNAVLSIIVLMSVLCMASVYASPVMPGEFLAKMPVKEITVFKDGHAFVRHEGSMGVNADGRVVLDYLPRPVIGTFWTYSADEAAAVQSVTASKELVAVERTALSIAELIEANIGKKVRVKEQNDPQYYDAWVARIPTRTSEEIAQTSADAPQHSPLPVRGEVVMLKTAEGLKVVPIAQIERITFLDAPEEKLAQYEQRNVMTIKVAGKKGPRPERAEVGMLYLQRGIRWIPSYHVDIDGEGKAVVKLQATLVNELTDLEDVTVHLVIGVPTFAFKDTVDPISLEQTIAQLSNHFQQNAGNAYGFPNAIRSQVRDSSASYAPPADTPAGPGESLDLGPEVTSGAKNEDLYVFTVEHLTLKKGERMVLPVVEFALTYRDVYILELPFSPPPEVCNNFNNQQQDELARLMRAPKAMHGIRFKNDTKYPVTTAPALIFRQGQLIAQGMTKYTPVGATGDLEMTAAVDILVKKTDVETARVPNAVNWCGYEFARCDLKGTIKLTSHKDGPVEIEVRRFVLGTVDGADAEGKVEHLGWAEGGWSTGGKSPTWWNWYGWPYWWHHMNPVGRVEWRRTLEPGETVSLEYTWHYFWRY